VFTVAVGMALAFWMLRGVPDNFVPAGKTK
jgi:hypothetical protein